MIDDERIPQKTKELIAEYLQSYPVKISEMATALGLTGYYSSDYGDGISGAIVPGSETIKPGTSGFAIIVNKNEPITRRRFTIAHEIAHYLLHKDLIGTGLSDSVLYRSGLSNKQEVEANKLAADLLMPYELIDKLIDSGITNIDDIADKLNVSRSAIRIRLGIPY